jgi:hypothetical protein
MTYKTYNGNPVHCTTEPLGCKTHKICYQTWKKLEMLEAYQELTDSFDDVPRVIISPCASSAGSPQCLDPTFGWWTAWEFKKVPFKLPMSTSSHFNVCNIPIHQTSFFEWRRILHCTAAHKGPKDCNNYRHGQYTGDNQIKIWQLYPTHFSSKSILKPYIYIHYYDQGKKDQPIYFCSQIRC